MSAARRRIRIRGTNAKLPRVIIPAAQPTEHATPNPVSSHPSVSPAPSAPPAAHAPAGIQHCAAPADGNTPPSIPRRRTWLRWTRLLSIASGLVAVGYLSLASMRPAWYQPVPIDFARLPDDKSALFSVENAISAALNAGRPATITLDEAQLNRWIAARGELDAASLASSAGWSDPVVRLEAGTIRLGARLERGKAPFVMSVALRPVVDDGVLDVRIEAISIGRARVPVSLLLPWVRSLTTESLPNELALHDRGVRVVGRLVWPNGRRAFRVSSVDVELGHVTFVLEPLATAPGRR